MSGSKGLDHTLAMALLWTIVLLQMSFAVVISWCQSHIDNVKWVGDVVSTWLETAALVYSAALGDSETGGFSRYFRRTALVCAAYSNCLENRVRLMLLHRMGYSMQRSLQFSRRLCLYGCRSLPRLLLPY